MVERTEEDCLQKQIRALGVSPCHYCDWAKIQKIKGKDMNGVFEHVGIDRVNNNEGYTVANAVPCCSDCNRAKRNLAYSEFLAWVEKVYEYSIKKFMKIAKAKFHGQESFNDYDVELSWSQLNAIYTALEKDHSDPLCDELFAELGYYLSNLPGPGQDSEEFKASKDAEKQAIEAGEDAGPEGSDRDPDLLGDEVQQAPEEDDDEFGQAGGPKGSKSPAKAKKPHEEEADQLLERPPRRESEAA
jgi:hypothetical protein